MGSGLKKPVFTKCTKSSLKSQKPSTKISSFVKYCMIKWQESRGRGNRKKPKMSKREYINKKRKDEEKKEIRN